VLPFFVEDDEEAFADREAAGRRPAWCVDRFGADVQRRVGQAVDELAHGGHPVAAQREDLLERGASGAVPGYPGGVPHLVPRQVQRIPRRRVAKHRPPDPRVGGERQVPQRLSERPLPVDRLVQQLRRQTARPGHRLVPEPVQGVPRLAEARRVRRAHLGPVGVAPVQFGVDQRPDIDAVDRHVLDLAGDVDVAQFDAAQHRLAQRDAEEPAPGQVDRPELRAAEVDALEPRTGQVVPGEVSHDPTVRPFRPVWHERPMAKDLPIRVASAIWAVGPLTGPSLQPRRGVPRRSLRPAADSEETIHFCRKSGVAPSYSYALFWMPSVVAAIVIRPSCPAGSTPIVAESAQATVAPDGRHL
jgi:hypothetical protein